MQLNRKSSSSPVVNFHGVQVKRLPAEQNLRRAVMTCMLWEDSFYEDGVSIAERIKQLVHALPPHVVAPIAIEARNQMKLRHVPLLIVREMARHPALRMAPELVRNTLAEVIQRPDELTEFLSIYWKDGKTPLSAQVKKGLAKAFAKFNEYSLAKYNRDKAIKLRDVLFLSHSKPADVPSGAPKWNKDARKLKQERTALSAGEQTYLKLVDGTLETPDTWEVALSGGADKKLTFQRLMSTNKLGGLAFVRNLRNMTTAGISATEIKTYGDTLNFERLLPFRFIAAARTNPGLEHIIEPWMLKCLEEQGALPGRTVFLVDVSGSMFGAPVSKHSDLNRFDAAAALTILGREMCEDVGVYTFSTELVEVPSRRGFALRDAMRDSQARSNTYLGRALNKLALKTRWDRLVVITDEQSSDAVPAKLPGRKYLINVASYQNSIAHSDWTRITGWSESVMTFIRELEARG